MATREENLRTALDNIAVRIKELSEHNKPDYSVDGKSYSWAGYMSMLLSQQKALEDALVRAGGPYEIQSRGVI